MEKWATFKYFGWDFGIKAVLRRLYDDCIKCVIETKP